MLGELRWLRSRPVAFTTIDLLQTPCLLRYLGGGDPGSADSALREVFGRRLFNNLDVRTFHTHLTWNRQGESQRQRLKKAADDLAIDPRNAANYSDRGMTAIAKSIVSLIWDADSDSYTQHGLGIMPMSSGRYRVILRVRAWGLQEPKRPLWVELNRKRVMLRDGKVTSETSDQTTLEWSWQRKLPKATLFESQERAVTWTFALACTEPPRTTFVDRLKSNQFTVTFRTFSGLLYVDLHRK